mgnify:CR=1 FL=1
MDKKVKAAYAKSIQGNKLVGALGSTPTADRDGDIVEPMGMDVRSFLKNPVLLWSHDPYSLPIGKVTDIRVSQAGLEFDAEFASEINPLAKQVRDLFEGGYLNAFSIGFIPKTRQNERIVESELLEISAVNIPANPEALASRAYKNFMATVEDVSIEKKPKDRKLTKAHIKIKILNKLLKA